MGIPEDSGKQAHNRIDGCHGGYLATGHGNPEGNLFVHVVANALVKPFVPPANPHDGGFSGKALGCTLAPYTSLWGEQYAARFGLGFAKLQSSQSMHSSITSARRTVRCP